MSYRIEVYMALETIVETLDANSDLAVDAVRDVMDELFYAMTDSERKALDEREDESE